MKIRILRRVVRETDGGLMTFEAGEEHEPDEICSDRVCINWGCGQVAWLWPEDYEWIAMLVCIVCDKVLAQAFKDNPLVPNNGVRFRAWGNYGSTVWDMEDSTAQLVVCDACFVAKAKAILVVTEEMAPKPPPLVQSMIEVLKERNELLERNEPL